MPKTNAIFDKDRPVRYELFTEGWLHGKNAWDRPVDVLFLRDGSLLLSDARQKLLLGRLFERPYCSLISFIVLRHVIYDADVLRQRQGLQSFKSLPDDLKALIDRQARVLSNASWVLIVDELIRIIERHLTKTRGVALTVKRVKERHQQTSAG